MRQDGRKVNAMRIRVILLFCTLLFVLSACVNAKEEYESSSDDPIDSTSSTVIPNHETSGHENDDINNDPTNNIQNNDYTTVIIQTENTVSPPGTSYVRVSSDRSSVNMITLQNGKLQFSGFDKDELYRRVYDTYHLNSTEWNDSINCFVFFQSNILVFRDDIVIRVQLYDDATAQERFDILYFHDSPEEGTKVDEDYSALMNYLNIINSQSRIVRAYVAVTGDTGTRHWGYVYVVTEAGDCFRCSYFKQDSTKTNQNVLQVAQTLDDATYLFRDGTVTDQNIHSGIPVDTSLSSEVSTWENIKWISIDSMSHSTITGVNKDGTVLIAGEYNHDKAIIESWTDVAYTITMNRLFEEFPVALTNTGNILVPDDCGCSFADKVSEWSNVIEIGLTCPDGILWGRLENGDVLFAE